MKKSIAALALLASASSAFALIQPPDESKPQPETKISCHEIAKNRDGGQILIGCDETENNKTLKRKLLSNTCTEDQVAQYYQVGKVEVTSCMPPGIAQL